MLKIKPVDWTFLRWILAQTYPQTLALKLRALGIVGMGLAVIFMQLSLPWLLKYIVNTMVATTHGLTTPNVLILCGAYGFLWIATRWVTEIREILSYKIFAINVSTVKDKIFKHLLNQSLSFHASRDMGAIVDEIKRMQYTFYKASIAFFLTIVPHALEAVIALLIMWKSYSISTSLIATGFFTAIIYTSIQSASTAMRAEEAANVAENAESSFIFDHLLNVETIQSFAREDDELNAFDQHLVTSLDARLHALQQQELMQMYHGMLTGGLLFFITLLTGYHVLTGAYSIGDFMLLNSYIVQFSDSLGQLGKHIRQLRECIADLQGVYALFGYSTEIKDAPNAPDLDLSDTSISIKNVTFGYFADTPILNNVSIEIPMGKKLAIVGPSGSGKSTLAKLLLRLYEPSIGAIAIGQKRICDITQDSLHASIGYVPQNPVLFHDTLLHNISYGNPSASPESVKRAAERAHLSAFISTLPQGYETRIGELGLALSGGERQRVALARVLLRNPAIFIFDEATSALDSHTEYELMKNLNTVSEGKTTVVIAHRLSTIVDADLIAVLDHGKIKEQGTHAELLALNKLYAKLWYRQQEAAHNED